MASSKAFLETGIVATPDGVEHRHFAYPGSLVRLPDGRLLAVFTSTEKESRGVGTYSADGGRMWGPVVTLFGGAKLGGASSDLEEGYADPNLVVVDDKKVLAFCVSLKLGTEVYDRTRWWRRGSNDGGRTFGPDVELPRHRKYIVGTIHSGLRLRDGTLIMSYSWDKPAEFAGGARGEGGMDLVSGVFRSRDEGKTWTPGADVYASMPRAKGALEHATNGVDEPAAVELPNGDLFMLMRTSDSHLWETRSNDGGLTWSPPEASPLVSHNCPASLERLPDGAVLAVFNHHPRERARLSATISRDGCRTWSTPRAFAPVGHVDAPEASYPATCQLADGTIVAVWGQIERGVPAVPGAKFEIRWARFNRAWVEGG